MKKLLLKVENNGCGEDYCIVTTPEDDSIKVEYFVDGEVLSIDIEASKEILEKVDIPDLAKLFQEYLEQLPEEEREVKNDYRELLGSFFTEKLGSVLKNSVEYVADYVELEQEKGKIYFDPFFNEFELAEDFLVEPDTYYHNWDGSNWERIEISHIAEIELSDEDVTLDIWDGRNHHVPGTNFAHAEVYLIKKYIDKIDNEEDAFYEGLYLLREWDQYQGTVITGKILTKKELVEKVKEMFEDTSFEDELEEKLEKIEVLI